MRPFKIFDRKGKMNILKILQLHRCAAYPICHSLTYIYFPTPLCKKARCQAGLFAALFSHRAAGFCTFEKEIVENPAGWRKRHRRGFGFPCEKFWLPLEGKAFDGETQKTALGGSHRERRGRYFVSKRSHHGRLRPIKTYRIGRWVPYHRNHAPFFRRGGRSAIRR